MRDANKTLQGEQSFLPPVQTAAELPTEDVRDGSICFVRDEARSYVYGSGRWHSGDERGGKDSQAR